MKRVPYDEAEDNPYEDADKLSGREGIPRELLGKSEELQKTYDNLLFRKKFRDNPLIEKHEYRVFGVETVGLNEFLSLRMWPRSIYVTDKLLRLVAGSKLEVLKRYLVKKRAVPMNMLWILLIIFGVVIAIVVILVLLPKLGVI